MTYRVKCSRRAIALLTGLAFAAVASASVAPRFFVLGENVQLACKKTAIDSVACDYRLARPTSVLGMNASVKDVELPPPDASFDTGHVGESAILLLVDTSDPARQPDMALIANHIEALLAARDAHHRFGFAAFDTELRMAAPIGSSAEDILAAVRELEAVGRTTELYRNTLQAIRKLAEHPAERKALFLFSDGLAEDQAYFHRDVVQAAEAAGVVIFGLGYARSVPLSVALQAVRRLAEETGGYYLKASDHPSLPEPFIADPYAMLDNGGGFTLDLGPAIDGGLTGAQRIQVVFSLAEGSASAFIPVQLPVPTPEPIVIEKPVIVEKTIEVIKETPAPVQAPVHSPAPAPAPAKKAADPVLLYVALGIGILLLVMIALLLVLLRSSRKARQTAPAPDQEEAKFTFGYLEREGDASERHPITSAVYRIGRHSSNDLHVADPSVSRQHAEIQRRRDGTFTITDLDSMNGVFVNNEQLKHSDLHEGDVVELGDVAFRFTIEGDGEALAGEETVMLKTLNPPADITEGEKLAS